MPKKTINEAITEALKREGKPLRVREIFKRIMEDDLYRFNAASPENIVRLQLRRHSENLDFPTAHKTKHFIFLADGNYWLKNVSYNNIIEIKKEISEQKPTLFEDIKALHEKYVIQFKDILLNQLINIDPYGFEHFCKKLLAVYGFKNLKVTQKSRDGGIDGYGELKIGLVYMNVAFECKRYSKTPITSGKVKQFRGGIQGKFQQGIYFTTSKFSKDAKDLSFQAGAVPIILIDGAGIIDMMVEKGFGIEKEMLPVYTSAIDLVLANND
jgi:restriction system protein